MKTLRLSILVGVTLAALVPAAQGAAPSPSAVPAGHQLWYRVNVSISGVYHATAQNGVTDVEENAWTLRSNTAILLERVCVIQGSALSAADIAGVTGLPKGGRSCDDLRRAVRGTASDNPAFLRRLRDEISVQANAKGIVSKWTATQMQPAHPDRINGRSALCSGGQTERKLVAPVDTVGRIGGSARNGISVGFSLKTEDQWVFGSETRNYGDCIDTGTGEVLARGSRGSSTPLLFADVLGGAYGPVHGSTSFGGEFGGSLVLHSVKIGNAGHLFGRAFVLNGTQPATHQVPGTSEYSTKAVNYQIAFDLCPNRGRDVQGC
jgi:hypothetical protein